MVMVVIPNVKFKMDIDANIWLESDKVFVIKLVQIKGWLANTQKTLQKILSIYPSTGVLIAHYNSIPYAKTKWNPLP